jgi:hypothetical protein
MSILSARRGRAVATALVAGIGLVAAVAVVAVVAAPAQAVVLFSDDFEQPTRNVWLTGSGGSWSVVTEDGSQVYRDLRGEVGPGGRVGGLCHGFLFPWLLECARSGDAGGQLGLVDPVAVHAHPDPHRH